MDEKNGKYDINGFNLEALVNQAIKAKKNDIMNSVLLGILPVDAGTKDVLMNAFRVFNKHGVDSEVLLKIIIELAPLLKGEEDEDDDGE